MAKGIAEVDIRPRQNVFTFQAWRALGRSVKRGEHGVKVLTYITLGGKVDVDEAGTETVTRTYRRPHTTTVFHISQTEPTTKPYRRVDPGYVDPGELAADRWNEAHR
jgi:antirestriction protein ArdC